MLEGKALETGALLIEGCTARAFNVDSMHVIEPQLRVEVIPELPLIRVQTIPRCAETDTAMSLMHGEERPIRLRLENCSASPVVRLQLKVHTVESPRDVATIEFRKDSVEATGRLALDACMVSAKLRAPVLPLPPASFADLDVVLYGCSLALTGVIFTVRYSGSELDDDGGGSGGSGGGGGGAVGPAGSTPASASTPPDVFYRVMKVSVPIMVKPSITITHPEILSLSGTAEIGAGYSTDERCLLTFAVQNETSKGLFVQVSSTSESVTARDGGAGAGVPIDAVQGTLIHAASSEVFLMPIKRLHPLEEDGSEIAGAANQEGSTTNTSRAVTHNSNTSRSNGDFLSEAMQARLAKAITVAWNASRFVHGRLSFPAELLPASAARLLAARNISITFGAAGGGDASAGVTDARKHVCALFDKVEVSVTVTNVSKQPQPPLVLSILPFQDLERGSRSYSMTSRLEWVGSLECKVASLQPGQAFVHKVTFVCFAAGVFQLSAQCRHHHRHRNRGGDDGGGAGERIDRRAARVGDGRNEASKDSRGRYDGGGAPPTLLEASASPSSSWKFGDDPAIFQPEMGSSGVTELDAAGFEQHSAGWCDARLELIAKP